MTRKTYYILLASLVLAGLFLNTAELQAQSDTFDGTVIDPLQWEVSAPLGTSTVTQNDALLLTSDGTFGTFCNTPGLFGPGAGIALRKKLAGDFDIQAEFTNFSGPTVNFVQAFFNIYQDQDYQLHIKRIHGTSADGIQTVAKVGGAVINGSVSFNLATSGTFRITRSGSVITTFFNGTADFSRVAFSGPVIVSLVLLGPGGEAANVVYDNFNITSGTLVDPLLVCPLVPFDAFAAEVEIELDPLANNDEFEVKGSFTLGEVSDGIDPLTEDVSLQVGTFSTTIPAGSFEEDDGTFKFEGFIGGVELEVKIIPVGDSSFGFKAEGQGADLTGIVNPVEVTLTIGDDTGTVSVTVELDDEDDD